MGHKRKHCPIHLVSLQVQDQHGTTLTTLSTALSTDYALTGTPVKPPGSVTVLAGAGAVVPTVPESVGASSNPHVLLDRSDDTYIAMPENASYSIYAAWERPEVPSYARNVTLHAEARFASESDVNARDAVGGSGLLFLRIDPATSSETYSNPDNADLVLRSTPTSLPAMGVPHSLVFFVAAIPGLCLLAELNVIVEYDVDPKSTSAKAPAFISKRDTRTSPRQGDLHSARTSL